MIQSDFLQPDKVVHTIKNKRKTTDDTNLKDNNQNKNKKVTGKTPYVFLSLSFSAYLIANQFKFSTPRGDNPFKHQPKLVV